MLMIFFAFLACEFSIFAIGYLVAKYKYLKLLNEKSTDWNWIQDKYQILEFQRTELNEKIKKEAETEFKEFLDSRGIKFHESLDKQPILEIPKIDELQPRNDYRTQAFLSEINSKKFNEIIDEHRDSDKA